ncbi:MAG TPA: hypothetical protein VGC98_05305 [Thermoleophilaceae bacterium]
MEDHEEKADELERDADRLAEQSEEVQGSVDEARSDFESKLGDTQAPGLLEEEAAAPGGLGESEEDDDSE